MGYRKQLERLENSLEELQSNQTTSLVLPSNSNLRKFLRIFSREITTVIGLTMIVFIVGCIIAAPLLATHNPETQFDEGLSVAGEPISPNQEFIWGTDPLGRDVYSRVLYGGQTSLTIAFVVNLVALLVGGGFGLASGYFGGWIDSVLSRFIDTMLAFPSVLFAVALSTAIKPSIGVAILALSLISWTGVARVVRGQVITLKQREFIQAAQAVGVKNFRILFRHILPHLFPSLIVILSLSLPTTILLEASLSYLGGGVPPDVPSWGNIIQDGTRYYRTAPWIVIFPGLAIFLIVFSFNLLGDGLRDLLDPQRKRR